MDYHLHTSVTVDGRMNEIEACERAVSLGIQEIAFTNHVMLNQPDYTITPEDFIAHWANIQACQKRFPQLTIRLGLEMDYYPTRQADIEAQLESYVKLIGRPLDFVFGSVHEVNGSFFSNKHRAPAFFQDQDLLQLYQSYFMIATMAVNSRLFDVMAHPDLIKKFTYDLTPPLEFDLYRSFVEPFVDALVETGVGLEVNTKGLKLSVNEIYSSTGFIELYLTKVHLSCVEPVITLGSDAHKVDEVGFMISQTAASLRQLGVNQLTRFDQHRKISTPISN